MCRDEARRRILDIVCLLVLILTLRSCSRASSSMEIPCPVSHKFSSVVLIISTANSASLHGAQNQAMRVLVSRSNGNHWHVDPRRDLFALKGDLIESKRIIVSWVQDRKSDIQIANLMGPIQPGQEPQLGMPRSSTTAKYMVQQEQRQIERHEYSHADTR